MLRSMALAFAMIFLSNCSSTTLIKSQPSGAKVYADGMLLGTTPVALSDTKIVGSATQLRIKKDGCEVRDVLISRNESFQVGPCIGGVFVLFPFLWVMGYNPEHNYELECTTPAPKN